MTPIGDHTNPRKIKVFLVAGEASGDAYGAKLIESLSHECGLREWKLETTGWGGDLMQQAGMTLLTHYRQISHMGLWEVVKHLPAILGNLRRARQEIVKINPDVVVTIDFPGFNMRLAKSLKSMAHGAMRVQWVAPQVWAWKPGRTKALARDFNVVAPILPFEKDVLELAGVHTWNEGHPLLDLLPLSNGGTPRDTPLLLLPGSRTQELRNHLPVMVEAAKKGQDQGLWHLKDVVVAGAPGRQPEDYVLAAKAGIQVVFGKTKELLQQTQFAWISSGTATLEAALLNTPHVVVYKTSVLTYEVAKRFVQVRHIGLPNLLASTPCVPELIQAQFTAINLLKVTQDLNVEDQLHSFNQVRKSLGNGGASRRLAQKITSYLESSKSNQGT